MLSQPLSSRPLVDKRPKRGSWFRWRPRTKGSRVEVAILDQTLRILKHSCQNLACALFVDAAKLELQCIFYLKLIAGKK